jgi:pilus assembly protein CpaB
MSASDGGSRTSAPARTGALSAPAAGWPRRRQALVAWVVAHRQWLLLGGAISLGAIAAVGTRSWIGEQLAAERERLQPRQVMVPIVVARKDLPRGEVVDPAAFAVREVPRDYLAPGAIAPDRFESFAGAKLSVPLRAGEPLLQTLLEGADPGSFAARVSAGVRAFTVMVDEVNSLSGMLQPGDRIDLLLSARPPATASAPQPVEVTRTLLQGIRVLATGRQVRPGSDEPRAGRGYGAITVEVSPEQAQRLVVAQRIGRLTAMLRNPEDRAPVSAAPIDAWGLLGLAAPLAPPGPEARMAPHATELIVGGQGSLKPSPTPAAPVAQPPPSALPLSPPPASPPSASPPPAMSPSPRVGDATAVPPIGVRQP